MIWHTSRKTRSKYTMTSFETSFFSLFDQTSWKKTWSYNDIDWDWNNDIMWQVFMLHSRSFATNTFPDFLINFTGPKQNWWTWNDNIWHKNEVTGEKPSQLRWNDRKSGYFDDLAPVGSWLTMKNTRRYVFCIFNAFRHLVIN